MTPEKCKGFLEALREAHLDAANESLGVGIGNCKKCGLIVKTFNNIAGVTSHVTANKNIKESCLVYEDEK